MKVSRFCRIFEMESHSKWVHCCSSSTVMINTKWHFNFLAVTNYKVSSIIICILLIGITWKLNEKISDIGSRHLHNMGSINLLLLLLLKWNGTKSQTENANFIQISLTKFPYFVRRFCFFAFIWLGFHWDFLWRFFVWGWSRNVQCIEYVDQMWQHEVRFAWRWDGKKLSFFTLHHQTTSNAKSLFQRVYKNEDFVTLVKGF